MNKPRGSLTTKEETMVREFYDKMDEGVFEGEFPSENDDKYNFIDDSKHEITFANNNWYSGQINRNIIEGIGSYFWTHGAQYKV